MLIGRNTEGFVQKYDHPSIQEARFYRDDRTCRILFRDGSEKELSFQFDSVYLSQFGAPLSNNGKTIFISDWDKGLMAYDTDTGRLLWHYKSSRIADTMVFSAYVIAAKRYNGLLMLDAQTGEVRRQVKSSTIEKLFRLTDKLLLVDSLRGKVSVVDATTLETVRAFTKRETNPADCLSMIINDAKIQDGSIVLYGFEGCSRKNPKDSKMVKYERCLPGLFFKSEEHF